MIAFLGLYFSGNEAIQRGLIQCIKSSKKIPALMNATENSLSSRIFYALNYYDLIHGNKISFSQPLAFRRVLVLNNLYLRW
jgi:hypothetical protein